jgi:RecA/RadA recombinase
MALSKEKKKALQKLRDSFIKDNKLDPDKTKMGFLDENENIGKIERLPTGLVGFDVLTNGGWVKGKINQLVGGESVGKTTKFLKSIGYWQKNIKDFVAVYIPAEKSFDRKWAMAQGCEEDATWVFEPQTAEENLDFVMKCAADDSGVDCLIIDTLQALASNKEVYKGKSKDGSPSDKERSVNDDTMALLPRLYSQFLRMFTSKTTDTLTLILASQVRTDITSMARDKEKETGGNALKHYNMLNVKMRRASDSQFPIQVDGKAPPNSFVVQMTILKSKVKDRYKGNQLKMYFINGSFDHRFNVICISKDIEMWDGKTLTYETSEGTKEFKARGLKESIEKMPDEAVKWLEGRLTEAYTKKVMSYVVPADEETGEEDGVL